MQPKAFTLFEVLVVIVLIVLFARIGSANMAGVTQNTRAAASVHTISRALAFARHAAVFAGSPVTLCPGNHLGCMGRDEWHRGLVVFADTDGDGQLTRGERRLRQFSGWRHAGRISWRAFRSRPYLQFTSRGFTDWQNGSFVYCPGNGDLRHARRIVLNAAGRTYRAHDKDGDGIDEGSNGRPIRCS